MARGLAAAAPDQTASVACRAALPCERRNDSRRTQGDPPTCGGVEVDETFIGREPGKPVRRGVGHKMKVLTLVDRTTGRAKSMVVDDLKIVALLPILNANIAAEATIHTDEAMQ
jgi:hypothetical protein